MPTDTLIPYQVVLVDDHRMVRRGIKRIIEENPCLQVVGECSNGLELLGFLQTHNPHMVIMDISMPKMGGIEALRYIKAYYPQIKVLMLTMHQDRGYEQQARSAGAEGYLLKQDADMELHQAIASLMRGNTYSSPLMQQP